MVDSWSWWLDKVAWGYVKYRIPDLVVVMLEGYDRPEIREYYKQFSVRCQNIDIPVFQIWFDMATGPQFAAAEELAEFVTRHVTITGSRLPGTPENPDKYLHLWSPQDSALYYDENCKNIEISFNGLVGTRKDRQLIHQILKKSDLPVICAGGRSDPDPLTSEKYAELHRRSKIGINSNQFEHAPQIKGRVMEIMACKTMLMELTNPAMGDLFVEGVDYVEFGDDLLEKARYYINHPVERDKIAFSGYNKYMNNYTPRHFWERIFECM
jgi:glycosyltransferase involved in cell wall biosynthesis